MLELHHVVALGIFSTYFIVILALFSLILTKLWSLRAPLKLKKSLFILRVTAFIGLTIGSLTHTWFYMIKYMIWSFTNYELRLSKPVAQDLLYRLGSWLHETSLFKEAWVFVCVHPVNWWWSEQLCLFTAGVWTVFIAVEGKRYNIKHVWAYMLLGQIVAISVASNLFYLALVLSEPSVSSGNLSPKKTVSVRLVVSVLLSLVTVALSPFTSPKTFLLNLLVMHVLLFVPLISTTSSTSPAPFSVNLHTLYRIIHLACAGIHIRTVIAAIGSLSQTTSSLQKSPDIFKEALSILYSHPAQSSIGWDIIWTSLSFIAWILLRPRYYDDDTGMNKYGIAMYLMLSTPFASIAVTAPYALQPRGDVAEGVRTGSEEKKIK